MLKYILILAVTFSACSQTESQKKSSYFRGEITYTYTWKSDKLNEDSLAAVKPKTGRMIFEDANYESCFSGKDTMSYIYIGDLNMACSFSGTGQNIKCEDYSKNDDSVLNYKVYDTEEKILGQDCKVLEYQSKYLWTRYYVSKTLKLKPEAYQDHKAYNWSFYAKKTAGGLILKVEHHFNNYSMVGLPIILKSYSPDSKNIHIKQAFAFCKSKDK